MTPITGSIVALVTPMHDDGSVDYAALRKLVDWHIAEGTDCIGVVGTTGESATLDVGVVGRDLDGWCSVVGHRQMGMVLQDPFLFNGSVKENILFGRLGASDYAMPGEIVHLPRPGHGRTAPACARSTRAERLSSYASKVAVQVADSVKVLLRAPEMSVTTRLGRDVDVLGPVQNSSARDAGCAGSTCSRAVPIARCSSARASPSA